MDELSDTDNSHGNIALSVSLKISTGVDWVLNGRMGEAPKPVVKHF